MKYLRKFNESNINLEDIISYIRECFSEFYDNEFYDVVDEYYDDRYAILINTPPSIDLYQEKDIKEFIDWSTELNEFFLDIQVAINRFKDKYPEINVTVEEDSYMEEKKTIKYIRIYFIKYEVFKKI
jgi:hypothetical protein